MNKKLKIFTNGIFKENPVLILLLGHALNIAMGGLSILVHAVRLNTLEFSSAKGVTWSGFEYEPFRTRPAGSAAAPAAR